MNRKSENYLMGEYAWSIHGNAEETTYERELKISGKNKNFVDSVTPWIKGQVIP